jgi:hypothetical protein
MPVDFARQRQHDALATRLPTKRQPADLHGLAQRMHRRMPGRGRALSR